MKRYIICLVTGIIIGATGMAGAAEAVQAVFSKFNIVVNGEAKHLEADPLVYNGTTYLPVRVIGNMLGYDINFKADSKTIELNTTSLKGETVDMNWIDLGTLSSTHKVEIHPNNVIVINDEISIYFPENINESSGIISAKTSKGIDVGMKIDQSTTYLRADDLQSIGIAN